MPFFPIIENVNRKEPMVYVWGAVIFLFVLMTMHEDDAPLACASFMLTELTLMMHLALGWSPWFTAGLFLASFLVLYLQIRHKAKQLSKRGMR
jgi:hypothetical protein